MLSIIAILSLLSTSEAELLNEDPLFLDSEMKVFFEERVNRDLPPLARLEALVSAIFDEEGMQFSYFSQTRSALGTFRERSGDCLSFTNLLVALGRYFGLDIRFREVEVAPNWSKRGKLVVYNRHVNSVAFIGGKVYLLDLFPRVNEIEIRGHVVPDNRGLAHYYNNRGVDLLSKGSLRLALDWFSKALQADPDASFAWGNMAVAQVHLDQLDQAENSYKRAIQFDARDLIALTNLAELYLKQGRQKEAKRLFEMLEDFRDKNPYYHFSLGENAYEAGEFRQSVKHLQAAIERNPDEHHFHHAIAKAFSELGEMQRAVEHLEKAESLAPNEEGRDRYSQKLRVLAGLTDDSSDSEQKGYD